MLKSKRTLRRPVAPASSEFFGTAIEGFTSLSQIPAHCASMTAYLTDLRNKGWDFSGYVTNGVVTLSHPRDGSITLAGYNVFDGEPDLIHFEAALTEYAIWVGYYEILGWSMIGPVTSGVFSWGSPGGVVSGTPVAHDLWVDDTGDGWSESMNIIIVPSNTQV